jgi:co-chaperonin GroES (HSP10)
MMMTKESDGVSLADAGAVPSNGGAPSYAYGCIEDAFPDVDPEFEPFGYRVLVQIRSPMARTRGGMILPHSSQETEKWNTQIAKVISLGPVAFKNRETLEPWPEGAWVQPGAFVRVPKYGGDRWEVPNPDSELTDMVLFVLFNDSELGGRHIGDPLSVVAYI